MLLLIFQHKKITYSIHLKIILRPVIHRCWSKHYYFDFQGAAGLQGERGPEGVKGKVL